MHPPLEPVKKRCSLYRRESRRGARRGKARLEYNKSPYIPVSNTFAAVTILVFLLADISLAVVVVAASRSASLHAQNMAPQQQVKAEEAHYAALAENYEDIRRMRHEIANHLYAIRALIEDGRTERADVSSRASARIIIETIPRNQNNLCPGDCSAERLKKSLPYGMLHAIISIKKEFVLENRQIMVFLELEQAIRRQTKRRET